MFPVVVSMLDRRPGRNHRSEEFRYYKSFFKWCDGHDLLIP